MMFTLIMSAIVHMQQKCKLYKLKQVGTLFLYLLKQAIEGFGGTQW